VQRRWRRGVALGVLGAAAVAVFGVLPRWVGREGLQGEVRSIAGVPSPPARDPVAAAAPAVGGTPARAPAVSALAAGSADETPGGGSAPVRPVPRESVRPAVPAESPRPVSRVPGDGAAARRAGAPSGDDWSEAVSAGLLALDRRDFAEARRAFERAEAARAGTPSVADGLARAEDGLRAAALARHREAGEAAEAREEWRAALAEYDAALRLDPAVAFALAGRARAVARAELDERLEGYLVRPDRLSAEAVTREAEAALERAREWEAPGARLASQVAALARLVSESRTPVRVRLVSDGVTDVVVLRHGPLGPFREASVDLLPGTYVVVGRRRGYRDARRTLVVPRGGSPEPLVVRCDEAL